MDTNIYIKRPLGISTGKNIKLNWLLNNKFYTYSAVTSNDDEIILGRIGANDPDYNLRNEQTLIIRKKNTQNTIFASIIESHGTYDPVSESAINAYSTINTIEVVHDSNAYTAVQFENKNGDVKIFIISNQDTTAEKEHSLIINNNEITWKGPYTLTEINKK